MDKKTISTAALLGMIAIILGAFGAHALKKVLSIEQLATFETGVRYQMYHALFLLFIGIDSRFWGFVPYDHVVGKPIFIWLSWNNDGKGIHKIRWNRMFTTVNGKGEPISYFIYFIIGVIIFIGYDKYRKKLKI